MVDIGIRNAASLIMHALAFRHSCRIGEETAMHRGDKLACMMLLLTTSCSGPIRDQSTLQAIHDEALMLARSTKPPVTVPKGQWPKAIASLQPQSVTISAEGVDVLIKPYFDGGSGYFIPSSHNNMPEPKGRFDSVHQGVYWYHPY